MKYLYSLFLVMGIAFVGHAQVGIGTSVPNASAQLDVVSTDKGMLIPRVPLTSTSDKTTIVNGNVNGLIVFNTQTRADVVPGFYYWSDNKWNKIIVSEELQNIIVPTTNNLSILNEYLTSDVNGVTSTIDLTSVVSAATTNKLTLNQNDLISIVNGKVAQTQAVGVVENVISDTYLTTSVNGVDAKSVDLKGAVAKATSNAIALSGNILTSVVNGVTDSTDAVGNVEALLTPDGKFLTVSVNGVTSGQVDLTKAAQGTTTVSNSSLTNDLVTTVNGVDAQPVKIINSNILTAIDGKLVSSVNNVMTTNTVDVLISASNGLTVTNGDVALGGTLTQATVLTTSAANTLAISGLQPTNSITTDKILVVDATGVLKTTSSIVNAISTKTSDYTAVLTDETLLVDAIGGNVTITLPAASALIGKKYAIKKIDKTTNNVVINTGGGTIDTEKSITGSVWLQRWVIQSDGVNWYIIN